MTDSAAAPAVQAAAAIRAAGARVTPARVQVLALLRGASGPLTHLEVEKALGTQAGDRVTLYRALDWLVSAGLAVKATDAARVYRYAATGPAAEHIAHAHFRCEACGRIFCLDVPPPVAPELPAGFRLGRMEVDLHGQCPACAAAHP